MQLIAVSTESPEGLAKSRSKAGAGFDFVGDRDGALLDSLGLRHVGGHPMNKTDLARPASVLVDQDGRQLWSEYADNYRVRKTPDDLLLQVKGAL